MTDLILAITHHILVFGLIGTMVATRTLLAGPVVDIARVARVRWTDLRMTVAGFPERRPARGIVLSNWEIRAAGLGAGAT